MNELYHHGIKGMHWGVRRYQNPDGTLTDAGKRRQNQLKKDISFDRRVALSNKKDIVPSLLKGHPYRALGNANVAKMLNNDAKRKERELNRLNNPTDADRRAVAKKQRLWNAKNASQLSDKELTDQILRLQREKQLKDLTNQTVAPGRKHAKDLLSRFGDQALGAAVTAAVTTGATIAITNKMNKKWNPQKSAYDRMKEDYEAKTQLADEGMPVNVKGYTRENGKWVKK